MKPIYSPPLFLYAIVLVMGILYYMAYRSYVNAYEKGYSEGVNLKCGVIVK